MPQTSVVSSASSTGKKFSSWHYHAPSLQTNIIYHPAANTGIPSGEPLGKLVKVAGQWDAYLATPGPNIKAREIAGILFCPDAMGIWQNSMLMADRFAANGYLCLVIDLYNGDPLALNKPDGFDFAAWMREGSDGNNPHTTEAIDPIVEAAILTMKNEYRVERLGSVGYCFGAKVCPPTIAAKKSREAFLPLTASLKFSTPSDISKTRYAQASSHTRPSLQKRSSPRSRDHSQLRPPRRTKSSHLRFATDRRRFY